MQEWEKSQLASVIIISGAGEKAFCAGGDVAKLAQVIQNEGEAGRAKSRIYFELEYQLDHLIATYPKPYIAYLDGITMGGGAGLSIHAPIRIATERTIFAFPETTIGFFPDVGATFFLPRLEGQLGTYLALTSSRFSGADVYFTGIATHYLHSSSLGDLTARLSELVFKDYASMAERLALIDGTIEEFSSGLPFDQRLGPAGQLRMAIDRCFAFNTVEEIRASLEKEKGGTAGWAAETLKKLSERSPTSLKIALRQMRVGKHWSVSDTFQREYHIASRLISHPDFVSGVSARLLSKPAKSPEWDPPKLEQISNRDVDKFFKVEGEEKMVLYSHDDYQSYPFDYLGLPREPEVRTAVLEAGKTRDEIVETFVKQRPGKPGIREKVDDILNRLCRTDNNGELVWRG